MYILSQWVKFLKNRHPLSKSSSLETPNSLTYSSTRWVTVWPRGDRKGKLGSSPLCSSAKWPESISVNTQAAGRVSTGCWLLFSSFARFAMIMIMNVVTTATAGQLWTYWVADTIQCFSLVFSFNPLNPAMGGHWCYYYYLIFAGEKHRLREVRFVQVRGQN